MVTVAGSASIDPCSELVLEARAGSRRPLTYEWGCSGCDEKYPKLAAKLSTETGSVLQLGAGTKEMSGLDETYVLSVRATNFLGAKSEDVLFSVLKKSYPAPLLTFDPPGGLSIYRDQEAHVKVVAKFSACPVETGGLIFQWSLESATGDSGRSAQLFDSTGSELLIKQGSLDAGSTYTILVQAFMADEPSRKTLGTYEIEVLQRELVVSILGGTQIEGSTLRALKIDASRSSDPDYQATESSVRRRRLMSSDDPGLEFSWTCFTLQGSLEVPCRYKDGSLLALPPVAQLVLSAANVSNMYPTLELPYMFTLEVSKGLKTPKSFQMPVTLSEEAIPEVLLEAKSGELLPSGAVRINSGDQLVVRGQCTVRDSVYKYDQTADTHMQLKWTFEPDIPAGLFEMLPGAESEFGMDETLVVFPDLRAFVAGSSYVVKLECDDTKGHKARSSLKLFVNAPPQGSPCTACRLYGAACATSEPKIGQPIWDQFRFSCPNWADEDGPLEYQFSYSLAGEDESEVLLGWNKAASVDLILPPGDISLKARVRDSFGASTPWMHGEQLKVGQSSGRRLLSTDDRWPDARNLLQESLDLGDSAKINQLTSALAMQVDDRVAKKSDDSETASDKKEHLLQTLDIASKGAIKREGYVCEALSTAKAICSNSSHISARSVAHIATFAEDLLASTDSSTLAESCAGSVFTVFGKALGATYENRSCSPEGRGIAQGDHLRQFLTKLDISLKKMFIKSSSQLLTGQRLSRDVLQDRSSNSSGFTYDISRVSLPKDSNQNREPA